MVLKFPLNLNNVFCLIFPLFLGISWAQDAPCGVLLSNTVCPTGYFRYGENDSAIEGLLPGYRSILANPEQYFDTQGVVFINTEIKDLNLNGPAIEINHAQENMQVFKGTQMKRLRYIEVIMQSIPAIQQNQSQAVSVEIQKTIGTFPGFPNCNYDPSDIIPGSIGGILSDNESWNFIPQHPSYDDGSNGQSSTQSSSQSGDDAGASSDPFKDYLNGAPGREISQVFLFHYPSKTSTAPDGFYMEIDKVSGGALGIINGYFDNPDPTDASYACP